MHSVVNHLPMKADADWAAIGVKFDAFAAGVRRDFPAMKVALLLKASPTEGIFIGVYDDMAALQHVSANVAAPWFAENIRQYLAGPAVRTVGEVIGGFVRTA